MFVFLIIISLSFGLPVAMSVSLVSHTALLVVRDRRSPALFLSVSFNLFLEESWLRAWHYAHTHDSAQVLDWIGRWWRSSQGATERGRDVRDKRETYNNKMIGGKSHDAHFPVMWQYERKKNNANSSIESCFLSPLPKHSFYVCCSIFYTNSQHGRHTRPLHVAQQ